MIALQDQVKLSSASGVLLKWLLVDEM